MKRLTLAIVTMVALAGCGGAKTVSIHEKLLSRFPQYMVRKAFETKNNLFFYSFDVKTIRENAKQPSDNPAKNSDLFGLVRAWEFPSKSDFKCLDPINLDGFAINLYNSIQVFTPVLDFDAFMKKSGAIIETSGNATMYKLKPATADIPFEPIQSASDGEMVTETKSRRQDAQMMTTQLALGADKPITDFDSVKMCLDELMDYPAVVLGFLSESFENKTFNNMVTSPLMSHAQIAGYVGSFQTWGRSKFIQNAAFGSRWINGVENVKAVFVYANPESATEDYEALSKGMLAIPSFFSDNLWHEKMKMNKPVLSVEGRILTAQFDMMETQENLQFPLQMRNSEKMGDWGWLWLK
jgi:hypothetical protein